MSRIIITIIILLAADILAAGLLWYGYTTMQTKKSDEAKQREELLAEGAKSEKLSALSESIALAEDDRKLLSKYLFDPSEENQIKFISEMEGLGTASGASVVISSLTVGENKVHAEFVLKGTWTQVYHTLRLVEELPTRTEVSRFSASRSSAGGAEGTSDEWSGNLSLDIISLRPTQ
jgi:hypothetical protein